MSQTIAPVGLKLGTVFYCEYQSNETDNCSGTTQNIDRETSLEFINWFHHQTRDLLINAHSVNRWLTEDINRWQGQPAVESKTLLHLNCIFAAGMQTTELDAAK